MHGLKIDAFNLSDDAWQIVWPGRVKDYFPGTSEPCIQVHLAKLDPTAAHPLDDNSVTTERHVVPVRAGLFPALQMGSVWEKGICTWYPQDSPPQPFKIDTERSFGASQVKAIYDQLRFMPVLPDSEACRFWGPSSRLSVESFVVCPVEQNDCKYLILPRPEILRAYYAASALTTRCVFSGSMDEAIVQEKSGPQEGGIVRVSLRKHASYPEAWMIARYLADPAMQRSVDAFSRVAVATNVNSAIGRNQGKEKYLHIGFPFWGETELTVAGKYVTLESVKEPNLPLRQVRAYLAFRIMRCSRAMPFTDVLLVPECDPRQGDNHGDPALKLAGWGHPSATTTNPNIPLVDVDPDHEVEPTRAIDKYVVETFTQRFPGLIGKEFLREEKKQQEYTHTKSAPSATAVEADKGGTGTGKARASTTAQLELRPGPNFPSRRQTDQWEVEDFIKTIEILRDALEVEGMATVTVTVFGRGYPIGDKDWITCFPRKVGRCRSWHLVNGSEPRPRRIVVARITGKGRTLYLLELERKTTSCRSFGVCILHGEGLATLSDSELERFIVLTAENNGWPPPSRMTALLRRYVDHPSTVDTRALAKRIRNAIEKL